MAFDGITVAALAKELNQTLKNERISKIIQPEPDALLLTFKTSAGIKRLYLSANASLPLAYLTEKNQPAPLEAPAFCMLLRKHLQGGRIVSITQPDAERILRFQIEHFNEMGDLCTKELIVELMGKHSNIIFCEGERILDSIKHVSSMVSSVREVLPGRTYFIPKQEDKISPTQLDKDYLQNTVLCKPYPAAKAIYSSIMGFSPILASELCFRAGIDGDRSTDALNADEKTHLANQICLFSEDLKKEEFQPTIYFDGSRPVEFSAVTLTQFSDYQAFSDDSISLILSRYYEEKNTYTRIRQKSSDLRKIVHTALERCSKKFSLQDKQLADTKKREKYRIYGELLNTYGYQSPIGAKEITVLNYYDGKELTIPLDETMTASENAQRYFAKYTKLKRTDEALSEQIKETEQEVDYLESVLNALQIAENEEDLNAIRAELTDMGFIRRHADAKKAKAKSVPLHYLSSDGFHIYIGKNNYQNDFLTFHFANGGDWWFHAKGMPGSHVIVKTEGKDLSDRTFEEAASLAAFYSKGKDNEKVEVDYLERKNVKKPNGAAPGFVVYYTNYSMTIAPKIDGLVKLAE